MTRFQFAIIAHVIYIRFLCQIHSQYTDIWIDNMNQNNGWTVSDASHVTFGYDSSGCHTDECLKTDAQDGVSAFVYKSTNVVAYSSLQLQFDLSTDDLEVGDSCRVYYAYDSQSNKQTLRSISPPDGDRNFYANQSVNLPSAASANTVWIWLEAYTGDDSSSDRCYWDNVSLRGIATPQPTPNLTPTTPNPTATPTPNPTAKPTPKPTPHPTDKPTHKPTPNPTHNPSTKVPTDNPIKGPTSIPTPSPTDTPTPKPTFDPSFIPTKNPTTPSPTPPGTMQCGEEDIGSYNGETLVFVVSLPYRGDIQFDASGSSFEVTAMEAHTELDANRDQLIDTDWDHDEIITIHDVAAGIYKFLIYGGTDEGLIYHIRTVCTSESPTNRPSFTPTKAPVSNPTISPTQKPTVAPNYDAKVPTRTPSSDPAMRPSAPTADHSITAYPTHVPTTAPPITVIIRRTFAPSNEMDESSSTETESGSDESIHQVAGDEAMEGNTLLNLVGVLSGSFLASCGCLALAWYLFILWKRKKEEKKMAETIVSRGTIDETNAQSADNRFGKGEPRNEKPGAVIADWTIPPGSNRVFSAQVANVEIAKEESDSDGLYGANPGGNKKNGSEPGENGLGQCADCLQYKMGNVFEGNGLFYCDACWRRWSKYEQELDL